MIQAGCCMKPVCFMCAGHGTNSVVLCVPGMARIQLEINQPQVVTAKCSEPQVVNSDVEDGGSGVAILSSVRTEI